VTCENAYMGYIREEMLYTLCGWMSKLIHRYCCDCSAQFGRARGGVVRKCVYGSVRVDAYTCVHMQELNHSFYFHSRAAIVSEEGDWCELPLEAAVTLAK